MNKKLLLSLLFLGCIMQQTWAQTVTGTVRAAADNSPLPGVNVLVKGTANGTTTDADGAYNIQTPGGATLVFSFIGFASQEIAVQNRSTIDLQLSEDVTSLTEVVVTANAIEREKKSLGYAVSEIKNEELTKGKDRSVLNSLQGKVAGVLIQNASGSPGSSTRVVIRGGTSITGNNQALFVVDGIPIDNSSFGTGDNLNNQVDGGSRANDINPEDVESVTVLKGPTAAALYGSRASNGVILITTKSGKGAAARGKKAEITVSSSYTFEDILRLPEFQNEYGQGGRKQPDYRENFSWGPRFDGQVRPWGQEVDGQRRVKSYAGLSDNVEEFFDLGHTFTNNVSVAGGSETASYYASFGKLEQKGVLPSTGYDRTSVKVSGSTQLSNKFSSSASVNYIRSQGDLSVQGQGSSVYDQVVQTPRDISLLELKDYRNKFNDLNGYYSPYTTNPWFLLNEDFYKNTVERVLGNVQLSYKPLDWLDVTYRIGTDVYTDKRRQATAIRQVSASSENSLFSTPNEGRYEESTYNVREVTSDLIVTAKKDLSESLALTVLLGHNVRQRSAESQISTASELVIPGFYNLANVNGAYTSSNTESLRRLYGVYGDVNLAYRNFLFLGITGRNDWSSTLPKSNNSFFYPSINTSFVFTDAFNIGGNVLSYGKIRASAAQVGNDAEPYQLSSVFVQGAIDDGFDNTDLRFPFNGVPGFEYGNRIGNPDLKPEITRSYEVGLDLSLFKERISLEATYYNNLSRDQIINIPVPTSSGFLSKTINAGEISNQGIEVLLRVTPVIVNDFRWDLSLNYTKNESRVEELFGDVTQVQIGISLNGASLVAQLGQPYGSFFVNAARRDPQGRVVVDGETGQPLLDSESRIIGNIQPDYIAGLTNTFTFKGLSLSVLFETKQGGTIYSRTKDLQEFVGTSPNTLLNDREPFVIPNSVIEVSPGVFEPNTAVTADAQDYWTDQSINSNNLLDATYIKLREVALSYNLPKSLYDKSPFGNIQVGLSGRNLWLWTPSENTFIDPEVSSFGNGTTAQNNTQGYEYGTLPSLRSYGANVRLTF